MRFMKCFPNTSFTKQGLRLLMIFYQKLFWEGLSLGPPLSTIDSTWQQQFKQKSLRFDCIYIYFLLWHHSWLWRHITAKVDPRPPKWKMISIKLSFRWGVYQLFLLTLVFERMGRLEQIGSSRLPCKMLTLDAEIKKIGWWNLFTVSIINSE